MQYPLRLALITGFFLAPLAGNAQKEKSITLNFLLFPASIKPTPIELLIDEGKNHQGGNSNP